MSKRKFNNNEQNIIFNKKQKYENILTNPFHIPELFDIILFFLIMDDSFREIFNLFLVDKKIYKLLKGYKILQEMLNSIKMIKLYTQNINKDRKIYNQLAFKIIHENKLHQSTDLSKIMKLTDDKEISKILKNKRFYDDLIQAHKTQIFNFKLRLLFDEVHIQNNFLLSLYDS